MPLDPKEFAAELEGLPEEDDFGEKSAGVIINSYSHPTEYHLALNVEDRTVDESYSKFIEDIVEEILKFKATRVTIFDREVHVTGAQFKNLVAVINLTEDGYKLRPTRSHSYDKFGSEKKKIIDGIVDQYVQGLNNAS